MKKTITQQLVEAQKDIEYKDKRINELRDEVYELKKKWDDKWATSFRNVEQNRIEAVNANLQLQEIIRWHINPETAKEIKPKFDKFGNPLHYFNSATID